MEKTFSIYIKDDVIYFQLKFYNLSPVNYDIDFMRVYICEKKVKESQSRWSHNVLVCKLKNELYKSHGKAINNFPHTLPGHDSDLAVQTFKSPYILDFLMRSESVKEKYRERLIEHLKKFMLELGRGFAYVGNQRNLSVENDDYFLDLLFYNYHQMEQGAVHQF